MSQMSISASILKATPSTRLEPDTVSVFNIYNKVYVPFPVEPRRIFPFTTTTYYKKILKMFRRYYDNYEHCIIAHVWDTDSNKSSDFFLNPICIMLVFYYYCVAL